MPPTARPWFRMYSDILDSHKVEKLNDRQFRRWVKLLALANVNDPRGRLPTLEQMAYRLRVGIGPMTTTLEELVSLRFIDADGDGWVMHDWANPWQRDRDVAPEKRTGNRDDAHANRDDAHANVTDSVTRGRGEVEVDKEKEQEGEVDATSAPDLSPVPTGILGARPTSPGSPTFQGKGWGWDGVLYAYRSNVGELSDAERRYLKRWHELVDESWIIAAINETQAAEKPCWKYFAGIIGRCLDDNRPPSSLARAR